MNSGKEVLLLVDALSREKNVPKETVFQALDNGHFLHAELEVR